MAASTSSNPIYCPHCELAVVKRKLEALSLEVAVLKDVISSLDKSSLQALVRKIAFNLATLLIPIYLLKM